MIIQQPMPNSLFVKRLWTFSTCSMSRRRLGDQTMLLYSRIGRT